MSEEQVCKEIIEQVGYQEFYRYFQEKTTLIEQQRQEIKRLENIIKEAIEYIKKHGDYNKLSGCIEELDLYKINELLDILKGSDKE